MFCPTCGAEVHDKAVICVKCGCELPNRSKSNSDAVVYVLLGIFLGCFGAHNFYIGKSGKATVQLLMTLLSFFLLAPFVGIWALIEVCINAKNVGR